VTFKAIPGKVFAAEVMYVLPATAQGQIAVSGTAAQMQSTTPGPFFVRLQLADPDVKELLKPGMLGSTAIYTSNVKAAHVIRKVMIRMDGIMNYFDPR